MPNFNQAQWRDPRLDSQEWFKVDAAGGAKSLQITTGAPHDADRCLAILTLAFANDPAARWLYPDPGQYLQFFPEFARIFAGDAFQHGEAYLLNGCAAALWAPPGAYSNDTALVDLIERSVPARQRNAALTLFDQMEHYLPREPHWHLPLIGVDPAHQRNGYGSALLRYMLRQCDEQRTAAHLEATSPENVELYERHGFVVTGVIQARTSPPIYPMLRKPRVTGFEPCHDATSNWLLVAFFQLHFRIEEVVVGPSIAGRPHLTGHRVDHVNVAIAGGGR